MLTARPVFWRQQPEGLAVRLLRPADARSGVPEHGLGQCGDLQGAGAKKHGRRRCNGPLRAEGGDTEALPAELGRVGKNLGI